MVNSGEAITRALTKIVGGTDRTVFVVWFNEIVKDILLQPRVWKFLTEPLVIPIVNNQITIPAGVSEIISIQVGNVFFTQGDMLSDAEAASIDAELTEFFDRQGYTLANGDITFHPGLTGDAAVKAEQTILTDYADNADTIFPQEFENLFITGLRMNFYDTDKDGRFTKENMQYQMEMSKVKAWDNRTKPLPHFHPRGYTRGTTA
jgi:hypothetical protein